MSSGRTRPLNPLARAARAVGRRSPWLIGVTTAGAVVLAGAPAAMADNIYNNVDATIDSTVETLNLGVGANGNVTLAVQPTDDLKSGCNLTGSTVLTTSVASDATSVATVSPSSVTFTSCGATRVLTVHGVSAGDATISLTETANTTGGTFNLAPATFKVHVTSSVPPNTKPTLHLPAPITAEATGSTGAIVTYTATASDTEDAVAPTPVCTPASGSLFPIGTTTVNCTATDTGGLQDTGSFTVTVRDTTKPTVTISTAATQAGTGWYNVASSGSAGVTINVTANDTVDGALTPTCTDNGSSLALSGSGNATLNDGVHAIDCTATDSHSNTGEKTASFQVDQTLPTITASYAPAANAAGWDNANVTVSYTCADATSHLAGACPSDDSVTTEGTTPLSHTVTDQAGNSATGNWVVKLDKTKPTISGSADRAANGNNWYNAPVNVTFTCADTGTSGLKSCLGDTTLSSNGAGQSVTGTATDNADNTQTATVSDINIDQAKPSISVAGRTPANGAGWNNSNVTVSFSCTDTGGSGVDTFTSPVTLSTNGAGQSVTGTCTDKAGNSDTVTVNNINIDKTAPVITGGRTPAANTAGWNNGDVTVSFICTDAGGSGLATNTVAGAVVTSEVEDLSVTNTGNCVDAAGNAADSATVSGISIDKTAPVITGDRSPVANTNGWNNTNVTVTFTCADTGSVKSGIDTNTVAGDTVSTEGANQSVTNTGDCIDKAGNPATSATVGDISIDKTAPVISGDRSPVANTNGWNNTSVAVSFTCADTGSVQSGIDTDTVAGDAVNSEGANQSVTNTGDCTDKAGNAAASATVGHINIDETAPSISGSRSPLANGNGWNNTNVTVSFACADSGSVQSGIDTNTVAGDTVSTEGTNQSVTNTGDCIDKAGNAAASSTVNGINIDKTAPFAFVTASRAADQGFWFNHAVTFTTTGNDDRSGIDSCTAPQTYSGPEGANQSVSGSCTDKAGNSSSPFTVNFGYDATAPTLSPSVSPNPVVLNGTASASPHAADGVSGVATSSCATVNTGTVGSGQHVTCSATDNAGNTSTADATYSVVYATGGSCLGSPSHTVLQPVNADGSSVYKVNSTVPVKFRVCDANGNSISTPGLVTGFKLVTKTTGAVTTAVNEDPLSTTPDTAFRWSSTDQQWIYNLATKGQTSGTKLTYQISLNDGSTITFSFGVK